MLAVHTWPWVQVFPLHRPHTVTDKWPVHTIGVTNRMLSAPSQSWAACITNTSSLPLSRDRIFADHRGWESVEMVRRYAHLAADHLAPFADRLSALGAPASKFTARLRHSPKIELLDAPVTR